MRRRRDPGISHPVYPAQTSAAGHTVTMAEQVEAASDVRTYRIEAGPYHAEVVSTGAGLRMLECMMDDGDPAMLTETWTAGTKPPLSAGLVLAPVGTHILHRFHLDKDR